MTGCGYLPFGLGFSSDHRGAFVDLSISRARAGIRPSKTRRKINSKKIKSVASYHKIIRAMKQEHGFLEKTERLERHKGFNQIQERYLQYVDKNLTLILLTENESLQNPKSEEDFSAKLHKLKVEKHYWKRILKVGEGREDHYSLSQYFLGHKVRNITLSRATAKKNLRGLGMQIQEASQQAFGIRQEMLEAIASKAAEK